MQSFIDNPIATQQKVLNNIINKSKRTEFVKSQLKDSNSSYTNFSKSFAARSYEDFFPWIERSMQGEHNLLIPGKVKWFAKSSGTSSGTSKYIPLTKSFLFNNHIRASWFGASIVYHHNPNAKIFKHKNLLMGGTYGNHHLYNNIKVGDISGFTISNIPAIGRPFYAPDFETALLEDWDQKIELMSQILPQENIFLLAGVPTWTMVLFEKILEKTKKSNMLEVWPEAGVYMHGGVNFKPYRSQLNRYFPSDKFHYIEAYNASEGCFGLQLHKEIGGVLLFLDNEIFYEFREVGIPNNNIIPLEDVQLNTPYELIITTTAGLYRYVIGDVVSFTSIDPYIIKVIGRTKEYINAFGEELVIENAEEAIQQTCNIFGASINNYSVAPIYIEQYTRGGHQWFIEFKKAPQDFLAFGQYLDQKLQGLNSDYKAKRSHDLALKNLEIVNLPKGTFENWLRSKGKFGNQNKVPRLKNDRSIAEEILKLI